MITNNDRHLIDTATELILKRFKEGNHHIAAALRTTSGQIFTGVHVEAYVGRITICGEAVAIGNAATQGDTAIECIVAVNELSEIVSPCGMCRELISDYAPNANVIIVRTNKIIKIPILDLLPDKYTRE